MKQMLLTPFFALMIIHNSGNPRQKETPKNQYSRIAPDALYTVSMSYKDLKDGDRIYGRRYTITNNSGTATTVHWEFTGHLNCTSSGGFSGVESLIGYGYTDITTFKQIDSNKTWTEGDWKIW